MSTVTEIEAAITKLSRNEAEGDCRITYRFDLTRNEMELITPRNRREVYR